MIGPWWGPVRRILITTPPLVLVVAPSLLWDWLCCRWWWLVCTSCRLVWGCGVAILIVPLEPWDVRIAVVLLEIWEDRRLLVSPTIVAILGHHVDLNHLWAEVSLLSPIVFNMLCRATLILACMI